jgi:DNA-binding PadR family transcriptional regulator
MTKELVRLSGKEELILQLLIVGGEMYGLELVEKSGGLLPRGTVYVTLERMADRGLVDSRQSPRERGVSGIPRRLYRPTGAGARAFRTVQATRARVLGALTPALA